MRGHLAEGRERRSVSAQASFAAVAREDGRAALVTAVTGAHAGQRLFVHVDGTSEGTLGDDALDVRARAAANELMWAERSELRGELFIDVTAPAPRVLIFGAVAYAGHLAHLARVSGWRPYVIDPRARFATRERLPDAIEVIVEWPEAALRRLGGIDRATYLAVLSNDPKIDDEILRLALAAEPAYIGAMGSRHAQAERRARLVAMASAMPIWPGSAPPSASISGPSARPRPRCRSWPSSSPSPRPRRPAPVRAGSAGLSDAAATTPLDRLRAAQYCRNWLKPHASVDLATPSDHQVQGARRRR